MDVYSYGLTCLWLIFQAGRVESLPITSNMTPQDASVINLELSELSQDLFHACESNERLIKWTHGIIRGRKSFGHELKRTLISFFQSTLGHEPQSRCVDLDHLLSLIAPSR